MTELEFYNNFCEAAMLNKLHDPWIKRRESGLQYAEIIITSETKYGAWWNKYIGIQCMAELHFESYNGKSYLKEAVFVRLMNTKVHHGRSINAECFSIL